MRILAVSDIHGSDSGHAAIKKFINTHQPDILVIAGDITHFGPGEWARKMLNSIQIPVIAVNGNCDTGDVIQRRPHRLAGSNLTVIADSEPMRLIADEL